MCVHFVPKRNNRSSLSLEIRHPRPTSAWFTRTKLPPTFWHWTLIRGLEFCEYFIAFRWPVFIFLQWNASSGERIRSFLSWERLAVVFYLYTVIFVFKHYKQLLLRNNCIDGSRHEDGFFCLFSALISCSLIFLKLNCCLNLWSKTEWYADPLRCWPWQTYYLWDLLRATQAGDWITRLDASLCKMFGRCWVWLSWWICDG